MSNSISKHLKYAAVVLVFVFLFGCGPTNSSNSIDEKDTEKSENNTSNDIANDVLYPIELNEEETKLLLDEYVGRWIAYELPSFEEINPGYYRYDSYPQEIGLWCYNRDGNDRYSINYDVTPTANGHFYEPIEIVQEDESTYRIEVQAIDTEITGEWFDIDYFRIINSGEEGKIRIETPIRANDNVYFYSGDDQLYYEWLESNGYFVNGYNFDSNNYINGRIWPTGSEDSRVSIYEAKRIIEELGLVFETNIPNSEWDNPKPYMFSFIIDGEEFPSNVRFACKLGTTVFFYYY